MRTKIIAGNWKMNPDFKDACSLFDIQSRKIRASPVHVILAVPFIYLDRFTGKIEKGQSLFVAAQNCSEHSSGAYTGEVSASMLASIRVAYCIVGHSERRKYFNESDKQLSYKVDQLLKHEIIPIFCFGETLTQREEKKHFEIVRAQLQKEIFHLDAEGISKCILAYEPVWAIGTGITASPQQAQEMHQFIRNEIAARYQEKISESISILYGGSVTPSNAPDLFSCKDVDGALVGGASLKAEDFLKIINAMQIKISA